MKTDIDKLIDEAGSIERILMSDKTFKKFCKEEFYFTEIDDTTRLYYRDVEIINAGKIKFDLLKTKDILNEENISLS